MDSENLSKLQSVLNSLREAKVPKIFFNLLREFVNELFMNSSYKSMIKKIKNREMETKKRFWSLKTLVLEEMLKIYTNLETYIKKNNLNDSELSIRMKEFTNPPKQYVGRYDFKSLALKKIIISMQ